MSIASYRLKEGRRSGSFSGRREGEGQRRRPGQHPALHSQRFNPQKSEVSRKSSDAVTDSDWLAGVGSK